jgi:hypothetical protein
MAYLPVYCEACCHASMAGCEGEGARLCAFCEAPSRVVPGPLYSDADWLAFAELDSAVYAAQLDEVRAGILADETQTLLIRHEPPEPAVQRIIERLPDLAAVRSALISRWPRGPRMLVTLLLARSLRPIALHSSVA